MGDYLPGTLQDRLRELREKNKLSQDQVAKVLGVSQSTYGRIENGTTSEIGSGDLIRLCDFYDVPADYVLGRTDTPENTGYDIAELGLSVEAARNLYAGKVDPEVVSELLVNDHFAVATAKMAAYFTNAKGELTQAYNVLNGFSNELLKEMITQQRIPEDEEINKLLERTGERITNSDEQAIGDIRKDFTKALREIKKKVTDEMKKEGRINVKLAGEIVERVKAEIAACPDLSKLPDEEKKRFLLRTIMLGVQMNPKIGEGEAEIIGPAMENILNVVAAMNKEGAKNDDGRKEEPAERGTVRPDTTK